jgi:mRNA interferase MazF
VKPLLPKPWDSESFWVKADMIATVSFSRLELIRGPKDFQGKRKYVLPNVGKDNLFVIRKCVLYALGLRALTDGWDGTI